MRNFLMAIGIAILSVSMAFAQQGIGTNAGLPAVNADNTSFVISAASEATNTVTITTGAVLHGYVVGQFVNITGVTPAGYNGNWQIVTVPSTTTFTYTNPTAGLGAGTIFGTVQTPAVGSTGLVTTVSGLQVQVAPGPVYCSGSFNYISKVNLTLAANSTTFIYYRCPSDQIIASTTGPIPGVDIALDTTVSGATTITSNTDTRVPNQFPPVQDFVYNVPIGQCSLFLTVGALGTSTVGANPGVIRAATGNDVLQIITTGAANTVQLDCDISPPPMRTTAGRGYVLNGAEIRYGYVTNALTTITGPVFNTVTYPASGSAATGTVAAAGGTITTIVGTSHSTPGAATTTGTCFNENAQFTTPIVINNPLTKVTLEEQFAQSAASATTLQICSVNVYGSYIP